MQNALTLGNGQLVIRAGKVIHPDELIARLRQRRDGLLQDIEFLLRAGQIGLFDFALSGE